MKEVIPKAQKQSTTEWEDRPSWWSEENADDYDLLTNILDFGYAGFEEMLDSSETPFCIKLKEEASEGEITFSRAVAQAHINQLTRDLHSIDDSEE